MKRNKSIKVFAEGGDRCPHCKQYGLFYDKQLKKYRCEDCLKQFTEQELHQQSKKESE